MSNASDSVLTVDRVEDNRLVVLEAEDGTTLTLPGSWLPAGAREGDVLRFTVAADAEEHSTLTFRLDRDETERRRARSASLQESLPRGPEGDIEL